MCVYVCVVIYVCGGVCGCDKSLYGCKVIFNVFMDKVIFLAGLGTPSILNLI